LCPAGYLHTLQAMAKQSLGRNLGTLMRPNPKEVAAPVGAGVRSLMRGSNAPASAAPAAPIATSAPLAPKPGIPRWYLFAGDTLLVGLAVATIFTSPHPLSWQRELFCAALVMLAAVLAVLALLTPEGSPTHSPHKP
jgi:hypothetical protein